MQNKPNFGKAHNEPNPLCKKGLRKLSTPPNGKKANPNKPNSNPISAQTNPKQTQSNPKRTQFSSCRSLSRTAQIPACPREIATLVLQQRNCSSNGPATGDPIFSPVHLLYSLLSAAAPTLRPQFNTDNSIGSAKPVATLILTAEYPLNFSLVNFHYISNSTDLCRLRC